MCTSKSLKAMAELCSILEDVGQMQEELVQYLFCTGSEKRSQTSCC